MASQNTSSLISQIYKSRSILLQLMQTQNYEIEGYEGFSVNEVNTMKTNNQLDMILEKKWTVGKIYIWIWFIKIDTRRYHPVF